MPPLTQSDEIRDENLAAVGTATARADNPAAD